MDTGFCPHDTLSPPGKLKALSQGGGMLASHESEVGVRKGYLIVCAWLYFSVSTCIIVYFKLSMVSTSIGFQEM